MNITLQLQELDDLIIKHTSPPVTPTLRNKLHPLREQLEAYIAEKEKVAALLEETIAQNANLQRELAAAAAELKAFEKPPVDATSRMVLQYLFDRDEAVPADDIAMALGVSKGVAKRHCDILIELGFICDTVISMDDPRYQGIADSSGYIIISGGRKFITAK